MILSLDLDSRIKIFISIYYPSFNTTTHLEINHKYHDNSTHKEREIIRIVRHFKCTKRQVLKYNVVELNVQILYNRVPRIFGPKHYEPPTPPP